MDLQIHSGSVTLRSMAALTPSQRARLPREAFALPERRAYPLGVPARNAAGWRPDKEHIANARARAHQEFNKRNLTRKDYDAVLRRAANAYARLRRQK